MDVFSCHVVTLPHEDEETNIVASVEVDVDECLETEQRRGSGSRS